MRPRGDSNQNRKEAPTSMDARYTTTDTENNDDPVPCTDPWNPEYDYEFERSQIRRADITVLPPERFSNAPMPEEQKKELLGEWYKESLKHRPRNAVSVAGKFAQVCCGWEEPPTAEELYEAVHAEKPTPRQRAVFTTWLYESTGSELLEGYAEDVYTIRDLVAAMYRHGWETGPKSQYLNNFAQPPEPTNRCHQDK